MEFPQTLVREKIVKRQTTCPTRRILAFAFKLEGKMRKDEKELHSADKMVTG